MSAELRAIGRGLPLSMHRRGGCDAPRACAARIRIVADGVSAERKMAEAGGRQRSRRSATGASRRTQSQPRVDARRNRLRIAGERSATSGDQRGRRCPSPGGPRGSDRRALRRRPLARIIRDLSDDGTRNSNGAMTGAGQIYWSVIDPIWDLVSIYGTPELFLHQFSKLSETQQNLLAAHWCQSEVRN